MKNLTKNNIKSYLLNNYGMLRHDINGLLIASRVVSKRYGVKPLDIFFFMIENKDIKGLYVNSYGFNNSFGRELKSEFENEYYNFINKDLY